MIRYALKCENDHCFESWFKSAAAFEALQGAGHVNCAVCGSDRVEKAMMAPRVAKAGSAADNEAPVPVLSAPQSDIEKAVAELRRKVEESSDYVGPDFVNQARQMHLGEVPERSIYGEARPNEARALIEDGVPLLPLPFRPKRKTQ